MAILKKIHWCWLSGDPLPAKIQHCINSWKRVMPDYEIILWDKQRFDIHSVKFVEDACKARKWAFAADYIRLHALYTEGGIYLDSDVMVYRRFDRFLHHAAFSAVTDSTEVALNENERAGICAESFGAEKGNEWIKMCLDHYRQEKMFRMKNGKVDIELIPIVLARYAYLYFGFQRDLYFNKPQILSGGIVIYPGKYLTNAYGELSLIKTYAVHLGMGSWRSEYVPQSGILKPFRVWYHNLITKYWILARLHAKIKQCIKISLFHVALRKFHVSLRLK
jgi:hypothetical protein